MAKYTDADVATLQAAFARHAAAHAQGTRAGNARATNRAYHAIVPIAVELRARGAEGTAAIVALLADADPAVRVWAGSQALFVSPQEGEATLRAVASGPPSPECLDATMTLREWRAGRLKPLGA